MPFNLEKQGKILAQIDGGKFNKKIVAITDKNAEGVTKEFPHIHIGDVGKFQQIPDPETERQILYIFGAFLVYTGAKIIFAKEEEHSLDTNPVVKFCRKNFGVSDEYHGHALTVLQNGKRVLTMFALTVVVLGTSDVIFAIDSIPAVFAITQNTYIVFTANVFSVLGLRAIFFLIANILHRFYYLKHALSIILAFIGVKMLIVDFYHIHTSHSLIFIVCVFVIAILASVVRKER